MHIYIECIWWAELIFTHLVVIPFSFSFFNKKLIKNKINCSWIEIKDEKIKIRQKDFKGYQIMRWTKKCQSWNQKWTFPQGKTETEKENRKGDDDDHGSGDAYGQKKRHHFYKEGM